MMPASSRARTRRRQGGAEMPARRASSTLVMRPSACRLRKIRRSIRSSLIRRILSPPVSVRIIERLAPLRNFVTGRSPGLPKPGHFRKPRRWRWIRSAGYCTTARRGWRARRSGSPRQPDFGLQKSGWRSAFHGSAYRHSCGRYLLPHRAAGVRVSNRRGLTSSSLAGAMRRCRRWRSDGRAGGGQSPRKSKTLGWVATNSICWSYRPMTGFAVLGSS